MQITSTGRHIEITPALHSYIEKRFSKLKLYFGGESKIHVILAVEKNRHMAEATIQGNGTTLCSKVQLADMYSAIDQLSKKMDKQITRYKEKLKTHKVKNNVKPLLLESTALPEGSLQKRVIINRKYEVKPMDVEEATMELDAFKKEFLVFSNRISGEINVIYHRVDGNYGLIETIK